MRSRATSFLKCFQHRAWQNAHVSDYSEIALQKLHFRCLRNRRWKLNACGFGKWSRPALPKYYERNCGQAANKCRYNHCPCDSSHAQSLSYVLSPLGLAEFFRNLLDERFISIASPLREMLACTSGCPDFNDRIATVRAGCSMTSMMLLPYSWLISLSRA